jgi:hypothetical protein
LAKDWGNPLRPWLLALRASGGRRTYMLAS